MADPTAFFACGRCIGLDEKGQPVHEAVPVSGDHFHRTTEVVLVDVREAFEAKARLRWRHPEDFDQRIGAPPGTYNNIEVQAAWWGYQQRALDEANETQQPRAALFRSAAALTVAETGPAAYLIVWPDSRKSLRFPDQLTRAQRGYAKKYHATITPLAPMQDAVALPEKWSEAAIIAAMEASVCGRPSVDDDSYVRGILDAALTAQGESHDE